MPGLRFFRSNQEMMRFPLPEGTIKIGRHPESDVSLQEKSISRLHALIEFRNGAYWVIDKSRNGTLLNNRAIVSRALSAGDELTIGPWRVLFSDDETPSEQETVIAGKRNPASFCGMVGEAPAMRRLYALIEKVAEGDVTPLICGETGSGKELVARAIHLLSEVSKGPFVAINCGAISPQLVESELFGHEKGAFTGATERHEGAFEEASGGTLFLDEIGELPFTLQPKLLRALETKTIRRVGGKGELPVDCRLVAATHRDLAAWIKEGKFREDLFFRLGIPLVLPPLRERREDIPLLTNFFLQTFRPAENRKVSLEAMAFLQSYAWPGNVRELKNALARALLLTSGETIPKEAFDFLESSGLREGSSLRDREREVILSALNENGWNKKKAASRLGIARSTLFQKIKDYGLAG